MAGEAYYFTLPARDLAKAKAFYAALFGWEFEDGGHIKNVASPGGGLSAGSEESRPAVFLRVDDVQAAAEKIRSLGGEAEDVRESASGWWASCQDDQGTHFFVGKLRPGFE